MFPLKSHLQGTLSLDCHNKIGFTMVVRTISGWGWQSYKSNQESVFDRSSISNAYLMFALRNTHQISGVVVAVSGKILGNSTYSDYSILGFPMACGKDFDFDKNICSAWKVYIGVGKLSKNNNDIPVLEADELLVGYGIIAGSKELISQNIPGISSLDKSFQPLDYT